MNLSLKLREARTRMCFPHTFLLKKPVGLFPEDSGFEEVQDQILTEVLQETRNSVSI